MLPTPTTTRPRQTPPSPRSAHAFTLIEILVTVAIIIILVAITIGVGSQVKTGASTRSTKVTLKTLEGLMKDYLAAGNPEPQPLAASAWDARYGTGPNWPSPTFAKTLDSSFTGTQSALAACSSDPINWVKALRANPEYAKKLSNMNQGTDPTVSPADTTILDSFGTPIRYVPYNATTRKEGYFVSAGPDRVFANENPIQVIPAPTTNPLPSDDIYSTDP